LIVKAQNVLDKITATPYQKKVLEAVIHRLLFHHGDVERTNQWAHEAFDENERLIKLIRERWEAGWKGDNDGGEGGNGSKQPG
jgi:hypothetical protein